MDDKTILYIKSRLHLDQWSKTDTKKIYSGIQTTKDFEYRCFCSQEERDWFRKEEFPKWYENNKHLFES